LIALSSQWTVRAVEVHRINIDQRSEKGIWLRFMALNPSRINVGRMAQPPDFQNLVTSVKRSVIVNA